LHPAKLGKHQIQLGTRLIGLSRCLLLINPVSFGHRLKFPALRLLQLSLPTNLLQFEIAIIQHCQDLPTSNHVTSARWSFTKKTLEWSHGGLLYCSLDNRLRRNPIGRRNKTQYHHHCGDHSADQFDRRVRAISDYAQR